MITKAYKVIMSRGEDIPIDPSEVQVVQIGASQGKLIRVRQGLINPSYLVSIVEDKERKQRWLEDTKYSQEKKRRLLGMESLTDIFSDEPLRLES